MAPFQYQAYRSPYTATMADLIGAPERAQAQAELAKGQSSARLWGGVGQETAQTLNQIALYKAQEPYRQAELLRVKGMQRDAQDEDNIRSAYAQAKGDPAEMKRLLSNMPGGVSLKAQTTLDALDAKQQATHHAQLSQLGSEIHDFGDTPDAAQRTIDNAVKRGWMTQDDGDQMLGVINSDPTKIPALSRAWIGLTEEGRKRLDKTEKLGPDDKLISTFDPSKPIATGTPKPPVYSIEKSTGTDGLPVWKAVPHVEGATDVGPPLEGVEAYIAAQAQANNTSYKNVTPPDRLKWTTEYEAATHPANTLNALSPIDKERTIKTILAEPSVYKDLPAGTKQGLAADLYERGFRGFDAASQTGVASAERWRMNALASLKRDEFNAPYEGSAAEIATQHQAALDRIEASFKLQLGQAAAGQPVVQPPPATGFTSTPVPGTADDRQFNTGAPIAPRPAATPPPATAPPVRQPASIANPEKYHITGPDGRMLEFNSKEDAEKYAKKKGWTLQ